MKVAINTKFGGFRLSPLAVLEIAKRKGKECFFFSHDYKTDKFTQLSLGEAMDEIMFHAFSVSNPQDYNLSTPDEDGLYHSANARSEKISISSSDYDRSDPDLIAVIEELKDAANTEYSKLKIVEIPDGTNFVIEEYDGNEHIAEAHKEWY